MAETKQWRAQAVFCNDAEQFRYTDYDERFDSEEDALDWINGEEGDQAAAAASLDTKNDADLAGYWLDDLIVLEA
jgi:hypothetical protein